MEPRRTDDSRLPIASSIALAVAVAVGLLVVAVIAGAVVLVQTDFFGTASVKPLPRVARGELVRWYQASGRVAVVARCSWLPDDSQSNTYECVLRAPCHGRVVFDVPRAGTPERFDAAAAPNGNPGAARSLCPQG